LGLQKLLSQPKSKEFLKNLFRLSFFLPWGNIENRFGGKFTIFFNMSLSADVISKIVQCLIGLNVYKIILFGSYARGTANEDSDIDLVVILDTDEFAKTVDERLDRKQPINKSIREIRKDFPMDIVVYSKAEYKYLKDRGDAQAATAQAESHERCLATAKKSQPNGQMR
jgi:uncharacterized protein